MPRRGELFRGWFATGPRSMLLLTAGMLLTILLALGCGVENSNEVVVYCALDREFAEPVLHEFAQQSAIRVLPKYDVESTKTVGLTSAIIAEANRPRCDVFWNNEILNTLRLQRKGLLDVYHAPAAESYPEMMRDPQGAWHGFAARARILLVNTNEVTNNNEPTSIFGLLDSKFKGRVGIAKPLFGTTATQAACLFAAWGDDKAKHYFAQLKSNDVKIFGGNKQVAAAVASGEIAFGLTDTDDALIEIAHASPVKIVYPDRGEHEIGTLFIPNTISIMRQCRHPTAARQLIDHLLSPAVEKRLAEGPSGQIPLNPAVTADLQVESPRTVKAMPVDFPLAAEKWDTAASYLRETFMSEP